MHVNASAFMILLWALVWLHPAVAHVRLLPLQVICEGTNSPDVRVREASFECFVKIASSYYDKLPPYMVSFQLACQPSIVSAEPFQQ
jgi:hypothetical protein